MRKRCASLVPGTPLHNVKEENLSYHSHMRTMGRCAAIFLTALLAACGSMNLWPFGEPRATEASRQPANAVEYRCAGGKQFYVRDLDAGAVWLIAPDREIRLEKLAGATAAYGVGKVRLELTGQSATLFDPPAQFLGCKRAEAKS
jgi:hypothetical protein